MTLGVILTTALNGDVLGPPKDVRLVDTPYGSVEQQTVYTDHGPVLTSRRSLGNSMQAPHQVNFRANMFGFVVSGVTSVLATNVVGSLRPDLPPGTVVVPDQFLDFTRQRPATIFDTYGHRQVDVTEPFCPRMRRTVVHAADTHGTNIVPSGTYVSVDGPRFETRAEVTAFAQLGGHVVGMTCATEAILARELGLCFASVAIVSNFGAGIDNDQALTAPDMVRTATAFGSEYRALIRRATEGLLAEPNSHCCPSVQPPTTPTWRSSMLRLTGEADG